MTGHGNSGNRQDNRQRGNAAQLLEKYKSMARDSQLAGDRVQTEYYLQFADHYFRVLGDSRPRADEQQRRQRGDDDGDQDDDGDDRMDADMDGDNDSYGDDDQPQQQQQQQRNRSDERPQRDRPRQQADRQSADRQVSDRAASDRPASDRPEPRRERANGRVRDDGAERGRVPARESSDERIDFAVLPPAIGADDGGFTPSVDDEAPAPKRRVRRPRAEATESGDSPSN